MRWRLGLHFVGLADNASNKPINNLYMNLETSNVNVFIH